MITHQNIWQAIDMMAAKAGFSASRLAREAGLDPTSFNPSKRFGPDGRPRWPSTETVARVMVVSGVSMKELARLIDGVKR